MERSVGTIRTKEGDNIILENIHLWFVVTESRGLKSWHGGFKLPSTKYIEPDAYKLFLEDGRSGEIIIDKINISGKTMSVHFQGSGPIG